jgi:hypothetical protein
MSDLSIIAKEKFYYINWDNNTVECELLVPDSDRDWAWYSQKNDMYLYDTDLFDNSEDALRFLINNVNQINRDQV